MNELMIFHNPEFGEIRIVEKDGEPWMVGKDVAAALGYERTAKSIQDHVDTEDKDEVPIQDSIGRMQKTPVINESGLYSLVLSSKLPGAKKFKRWVTAEVLPSIRKTGHYQHKPMTDYQEMMAETRRRNTCVRAARILTQLAKRYQGTSYEQVLNAHATKELTGEYLLPLPKLQEKTYSAEEIGDLLGVSSNMVGRLANANGLKEKEYGSWFINKAKGHNKEVQCFRYYEKAIPIFRKLLNQRTV